MNTKKTIRPLLASCALALSALVTHGAAHAGVVTQNEAGLDAVYAQASIDIRYLANKTIYNTAFLAIDSDEEMNALGALGVNSPTVSAFFVDDINFCGIVLAGIAGCAGVPGNFLVIASGIATGDYNDQLGLFAAINVIGHELGHNLGLNHDETFGNLMTSELQGSFGNLLTYQIDTILSSPLVQTDALGQRYIEIQAYAVVADLVAEVPEPATYALTLFGLGAMACLRKRKAQTA